MVALESLASSAGAILLEPVGADDGVLDQAAQADAGVVSLDAWEGHLVDPRVRSVISSVAPGGQIAVCINAPPKDLSAEQLAERLRPKLDLVKARSHRVGDATIVSGIRRAAIVGARRKELRGLAHDIEPSVLVGRSGLTDAIVAAATEAVERHGLIKVKLTPQATLEKREASEALAWAIGAQLIQRVGKVAVLYRADVPLKPPQRNLRRR